MEKVVLVRYGEIGLKGKNRSFFEKILVKNIYSTLKEFDGVKVVREYGRIFVKCGENNIEEVLLYLQKIFGIVAVCPAAVAPLEIERIKESAFQLLNELDYRADSTFKVETKRPNKSFPYTSPEVSRVVGEEILNKTGDLKVDVKNPDLKLKIEIRDREAFIYSVEFSAPGGLPVGVTGGGGLLVSGGIDSPVAGWLAMKRGIKLEGIHFHSFPFTSERSKEKVIDLCRVLAEYGGEFNLRVVHFTDVQKAIKKNCPEELYVTVMRRVMFKLAERICSNEGAQVLLTGENLGQVASQTLESISAIEDAVVLPVLRPLVTMDKSEIIAKASEIGTYDISIQPYEDCCTLFVPKHPATKPKIDAAREAEESIPDLEELMKEALEKTEVIEIGK